MTIASTLSFLQDSAGAITTGTINSGGPPITFSIAGSEKVRVDSNGYLLVNYSSSQGSYHLQVQGNAYFSGSITAGNINAGTVVGSISTASSLASGSAGNLVYQISPGVTGFVPTGAAGTVLIGTGSAPSFSTGLTLTNAILTGLTVSTSTITGALTVAGGIGVGGNLYAGGIVNANQTVRTDRFIQSPYQPVAPRGLVYQGTGALSTITSAIGTVGPNQIATDPTGRFVYTANGGNNSISQYSINTTTGALSTITTAVSVGVAVYAITVDPTGRFVYTANYIANTISQYFINTSTGALTQITAAISGGGLSDPRGIAVDPTGRFLYVANNIVGPGVICQYSIQSNGALTQITSPIGAGSQSISIAVDPTGRFAYAANNASNNISQYSINQITGALSIITTAIAAGTLPISIAVDPTGRFVYCANQSGGSISQYSINQTTGALTQITTAIAAGSNTYYIAVDPTGRFVYTANYGDVTVGQYSINQVTGALTRIGVDLGLPIGSPTGITIDPTGRFVYAAVNNAICQLAINNFSAGSGIFSGKLYASGMPSSTSSYIVYINTSTFELSYGVNTGGSGGGGTSNIPSAGAAKTSSYTLTTADVGKFVEVQTGGSIVIPNSTFGVGDIVNVVNNSTGNITVTTNPTSTYIAGVNTTKSSVTLYTRGMLSVFFINGTTCILTGNIA